MSLSVKNINYYADVLTRRMRKQPPKSYSLLVFDIDGTLVSTYDSFLALVFFAKKMALSLGDYSPDLGGVKDEAAPKSQPLPKSLLDEMLNEKTPLMFDMKAANSLLSRRERTIFFETVKYLEAKPRLISYLLHRPEKALKHVEEKILTEKLKNSKEYEQLNDEQKKEAIKTLKKNCESHLDKDVQACVDSCFRAYPGVREVLDECKDIGTKVCLYTNSRAEHVIGTGANSGAGRLQRAGISPSDIDAIYCRIGSLEEGKAWIVRNKDNPFVREGKVHFYTKSKPNFEPVQEMMDTYGVLPENTLYFGESCHDLECVLPEPRTLDRNTSLRVDFAYQKQGALDAEKAVHINRLVRDHALGHTDVEKKYPEVLNHPDIFVLENGLMSFLKMIHRKAARLGAPVPLDIKPDPREVLSTHSHALVTSGALNL